MQQDSLIYALFAHDAKISLAEINAITDKTIKSCLLMLWRHGGFIYSGDFVTSGKKRKVHKINDYLVGGKEINEKLNGET